MTDMTPQEKAAEWDRRMAAYEDPYESERQADLILHGDPNAPKTRFAGTLKGSDMIVQPKKET